MINYIVGDATNPNRDRGVNIICHIVNNVNAWGSGFVVALSNKWEHPEVKYRSFFRGTPRGSPNILGQIQHVIVEPNLWVVNLFAQEGLRPANGRPAVRYVALGSALGRMRRWILDSWSMEQVAIHMPRIGCGLGGGDWPTVESIILEALPDPWVVNVYDLPS